MTYQRPPDVERMVREEMVARGYTSEDELLRDALEALRQFAHAPEEANREYEDTVSAVREGVADIEAGRKHALRALLDEAR